MAPSADSAGRRLLIVGHGAAGSSIADELRASGAVVVGFLDDAEVEHPDVLGPLSTVNTVVAAERVDEIVFAIPSIEAGAFRRFIASIEADALPIRIVPRTYSTLARERARIDDLTDVDVLDLVGRQPVKHDLQSSRDFIAGKRVLVTGAAGSIGSRLIRHVLQMEPAAVVGVDWWENGVFFLGQQLGDVPALDLRIADAKDRAAMSAIMAEAQPDIVFHASAYKHVPLMQRNPAQAIVNNVASTRLLVELAQAAGVAHFVYVSTDKAVNPVNVMGATKRLGELVVGALADRSPMRTNVVRFGNVIESNGSVMQIFRDQISRGAALTVTHEDVTRYFMTVDEATLLVIQSAFVGSAGDTFVLDMGEPVRIMDLARALVKAVDPSLTITVTGLRPGEKMYEELSYEPDRVQPTENPKIMAVSDRPADDPDALLARVDALVDRARAGAPAAELIDGLRAFGLPLP
jgi:FlaA1/EpsC-like NDP-sugar epimerase